MNTTLSSRLLAGGTVAGLVFVWAISGVFGTFSSTLISGQTCTWYGYYSGYGYGYDCTASSSGGSSSSSSSSSSSGAGGSSSSGGAGVVTVDTNPTTPSTTPSAEVTPSVTLFGSFKPTCEGEIENLTDPRLDAYQDEIGVIYKANQDRRLTRAEFLKLIINSAQIDVSNEAITTAYSDVDATHSLAKYISYATRNNIVSGSNGKFRPNDVITRAEAAKVFVNGANIGLSTNVHTFADVSSSGSLAKYIQTAYDNCILHGRNTFNGESISGARVFEPSDGITLAETGKVLYNINH